MLQKILDLITLLGKPFRQLFTLLVKILPFSKSKKKKKSKEKLDQSVFLMIIGIAILITVGFLGSVYSYMYTTQKNYEDNLPVYNVD